MPGRPLRIVHADCGAQATGIWKEKRNAAWERVETWARKSTPAMQLGPGMPVSSSRGQDGSPKWGTAAARWHRGHCLAELSARE